MVILNNPIIVNYKNNKYAVFTFKKNIEIPVIIDINMYDIIKTLNLHFYMNDNLMLYTKIKSNNKILDVYLHEIIMKFNNPKIKTNPILHINKINVDNRIDNLIYDTTDKQLTKNLNKKSRLIDLSDDKIDVNNLPSFVWYLNEDGSHGERFIVELGPLKWKSTSSKKLSLRYKLEEIKKFLRMHKYRYPNLFKNFSMNGDLNKKGLELKLEYYDIIRLAGFPYKFNNSSNKTDEFLKQDLAGLSKIEIELLKKFDIDSEETTNDRLKKYFN
jgi:hypothetical protein